ncbi:MAG: TetR/AcrR family transcriptional regulator [Bacteroidota bacterium]
MKHSPVRQHIITKASELFYAKGYNKTGINEIIDKAGIAKATLYHHFKSKEEICLAHLHLRHTHFMEALRAYIPSRGKGRPQLLGILDFLKELYREDTFNGCWCQKALAEIPRDNVKIRHEIQQQKKELLAFIKDTVNANIKNLSRAEAEKISSGLFLLYEGAISESNLQQNDWPIYSARRLGVLLLPEDL